MQIFIAVLLYLWVFAIGFFAGRMLDMILYDMPKDDMFRFGRKSSSYQDGELYAKYLHTEFLTAFAFVAVFMEWGFSWEVIFPCILTLAMITACVQLNRNKPVGRVNLIILLLSLAAVLFLYISAIINLKGLKVAVLLCFNAVVAVILTFLLTLIRRKKPFLTNLTTGVWITVIFISWVNFLILRIFPFIYTVPVAAAS